METDFSKTRWLKDVDKAFLNKLKTIYYFGKIAFMITEDDDCFSIGQNNCGKLGIGSDEPKEVLTPRKITSLCQKRITNFSCGGWHVVTFTEDGKLYTWGGNVYGQLGLGNEGVIFSPVLVQGSLSGKNIIKAACGNDHTLVLTSDGEIFATGFNSFGELGIDSTTHESPFVQIKNGIGTSKIIQISCGLYHFAAVSSAGEIFLWGRNKYGQLGTNNRNNQLVPRKLNFPHTVKKIKLGYHHTLALTTNGIIYAWGDNRFGQLGIETDSECLREPIQICQELGVVLEILAFGDFSCCKTDTNAYVWGHFNENTQFTPKTSQFTDLMQAALDTEVEDHFQPIIIAKKKLHVDLGRRISNASSHDATFVAEDSQDSTAILTPHRMASYVAEPLVDKSISLLKTQQASIPLTVQNNANRVWKSHLVLQPTTLIGNGTFGKVWKTQHKVTEMFYAIKQISIANAFLEFQNLEKLYREVKVHSTVKHNCIVEYYNCWLENLEKEISLDEIKESDLNSAAFSTENYFLFIQMELCDGDLKSWLTSNNAQAMSTKDITSLFHQLANGLQAIHQMNIIHRDLKPANIFHKLQRDFVVWKIGDFGMAFQTDSSSLHSKSTRGTFLYQSPEMQNGVSYSNKTDIYSLGLVYLETLLRIHQITNINEQFLKIKIKFPLLAAIKSCLSNVSKDDTYCDLLAKMLDADPDERPTADEIFPVSNSQVPVAEIVDILIDDSRLIDEWKDFSILLNLSATDIHQLEFSYKNGTTTIISLFHSLMEKWISKTSLNIRSVSKFCELLRSRNFITVSDSILSKFHPSSTIGPEMRKKLLVDLGRGISNASSHDATFVAEDSQDSTENADVGQQLHQVETQNTNATQNCLSENSSNQEFELSMPPLQVHADLPPSAGDISPNLRDSNNACNYSQAGQDSTLDLTASSNETTSTSETTQDSTLELAASSAEFKETASTLDSSFSKFHPSSTIGPEMRKKSHFDLERGNFKMSLRNNKEYKMRAISIHEICKLLNKDLRLKKEWKVFARHLKIEDPDILTIERIHDDAIHQSLIYWISRVGQTATTVSLRKILASSGFKWAAEKIVRAFPKEVKIDFDDESSGIENDMNIENPEDDMDFSELLKKMENVELQDYHIVFNNVPCSKSRNEDDKFVMTCLKKCKINNLSLKKAKRFGNQTPKQLKVALNAKRNEKITHAIKEEIEGCVNALKQENSLLERDITVKDISKQVSTPNISFNFVKEPQKNSTSKVMHNTLKYTYDVFGTVFNLKDPK